MNRFFIIITIFLVVLASAFQVKGASSYVSLGGGSWTQRNWTTGSDWLGGTAPSYVLNNGDNVTISDYDSATANNSLAFNNNNTLTVNGVLHVIGSFAIGNNFNLTVNGTLIIDGSLSVAQNIHFSITGSGSIIVVGSVSMGNNVNGTIDGNLSVGGGFSTGSGTISGSGTIDAPNTTICTDPNINVSTCGDSNNPLPVDVIYFKGELKDQVVQLSWATSMEKDFNFFTVERAGKDLNFHDLEKVYSKTGYSDITRSYSITDELPLPGLSYYRLKATDFNGTFEYHGIVAMHGDDNGDAVRVYPNPVTGSDITLDYSSTSPADYQIVTLSGEAVDYGFINPGHNNISFHTKLVPGIYIVRVAGNRPVKPFKLIVR